MGIHIKEDALLKTWATKYGDSFVRDGVVCEKAYNASNPKIVFILKEPHGGGGGDIRDWAKEGWGSTWDDISRWVYGIRHRRELEPWEGSPQLEIGWKDYRQDLRRETLRSICAMNLKKTEGGPQSNDAKKIKDVATNDKKELQEQYALYNPHLTICCGKLSDGTFISDLFGEIMGHKVEWKTTNRGESYYERSAGKYVIDFVHPAKRFSRRDRRLAFYGLVDTVKEVLGEVCESK